MFDVLSPDDYAIGASKVAKSLHVTEIELYCKLALATLLLYFTITTIDSEVRYFWWHPVRLVSVAYFLNRYVGLLSIFISIELHVFNVPAHLCTPVTWIHSIADWLTVFLIDYILVLRVLALHSQGRRLSVLLYLSLAVETLTRLSCMIIAVNAEVADHQQLTPGISCSEQNKCSRKLVETTYWIMPLVHQLILAVLALYKAAEYWRLSAGFYGFTLVKVLIRDQVIYFGMVILCSVINILKCYGNIAPGVSTILGSSAILCLLGSTMLVSLKEASRLGLNEGTSYRTLPDMEFTTDSHGTWTSQEDSLPAYTP